MARRAQVIWLRFLDRAKPRPGIGGPSPRVSTATPAEARRIEEILRRKHCNYAHGLEDGMRNTYRAAPGCRFVVTDGYSGPELYRATELKGYVLDVWTNASGNSLWLENARGERRQLSPDEYERAVEVANRHGR